MLTSIVEFYILMLEDAILILVIERVLEVKKEEFCCNINYGKICSTKRKDNIVKKTLRKSTKILLIIIFSIATYNLLIIHVSALGTSRITNEQLQQTKTAYYKTVEVFDEKSYLMSLSLNSNISKENYWYTKEVVEMTKDDFYKTIELEKQIVLNGASNTEQTTFKTLTISWNLVSGSTYKLEAIVDWVFQMPFYRKYDFLIVAYRASTTTASNFYQRQDYKIGSTWYNTSNWTSSTQDYVQYVGIPTYQAIVTQNDFTLKAHNGRFDLIDSTSVIQDKNTLNFTVNGLNTGSKMCATIKHEDSSTTAPQSNLGIYLNSNGGAAKFNNTMGDRSGIYDGYEYLYSSQTVCIN